SQSGKEPSDRPTNNTRLSAEKAADVAAPLALNSTCTLMARPSTKFHILGRPVGPVIAATRNLPLGENVTAATGPSTGSVCTGSNAIKVGPGFSATAGREVLGEGVSRSKCTSCWLG